jgi:para-aminobenzoate synthetase component 1
MKPEQPPLLDRLAINPREGAALMDRMARGGVPFLFIIDAWARRWVVCGMPEARINGIQWNIRGRGTLEAPGTPPDSFKFKPRLVPRSRYYRAFDIIRKHQRAGDSWLANLTFPSRLDTDLTLEDLARFSRAPYRLYVPGELTVFSPESFIRITAEGRISAFPMKGTIDATLPDAAEKILADEKEAAEHVTIVDLLRNDIGMVAERVEVPRYRFITEVKNRQRHLLQVSSEITGELGPFWRNRTGGILERLLPAGSVTGAPKIRTGEILREAEEYPRGWYTGVFGVFDGRSLESAVMIRYVEQAADGRLWYKSGGGITIYSDCESEYAEMEAKIYAPFG